MYILVEVHKWSGGFVGSLSCSSSQKYLHLHRYCCLSSSEGRSRWGPPRTDPHWTRWRRWGGWSVLRWRRAPRSLVSSLGQTTKSDEYFSLNHKKFLVSSWLQGIIWAFSSRLHCVKFVERLSRVPTGAAVIMRREGQHSSQLGTSAQQPSPGPGTRRAGRVFCCVHLSVVLTFALSLCYWRMSNVVGCLEISNYQAICQNVGRHLNYNSFGRWHEELAY